jgi:hypothetical protein
VELTALERAYQAHRDRKVQLESRVFKEKLDRRENQA